ncbi:DUF3307 domain-containing protein [Gilvibacter sediminis]|uniref:DUF3307 domain-containing protein n=1 Tax=Gilvibacter sediminis TaxID=379071 RepID=UPI002350406A|nr:DUF3307 domain-containing protein [Gilvibacter sediminis]MDC7998336.1 DUF3307 domain-containing protein [Gilvibacter sediminis]
MNESVLIGVQLLLAHILTDFVFQTKATVAHKQAKKARSWFLYFHALLAGILTYLLLQQWTNFLVPIVVTITHFFIDLWKLNKKQDNLKVFLLDQALHLLVLVGAWWYLNPAATSFSELLTELSTNTSFLVVLAAYLIVIFPVGFIIGKATKRWQEEIAADEALNSLESAGRVIGIFERILILTLILTDNFGAIGFLIGAKSILRFGDSKSGNTRKQTEYVLIGTLMSFALSIIVGSLVRVLVF